MNRTATLPSRRWRAAIAAAAVVVASLVVPAGQASADVTKVSVFASAGTHVVFDVAGWIA